MEQRTLPKEKILPLLDRMAGDRLLIAPVREEENVTLFRPVASGREVALDFTNTTVPPKGFFFPQTEKLLTYKGGPGRLELDEPAQEEEKVIFGMRPCDIRSITSLDPVFGGAYPDPAYQRKREKTAIIGMSCNSVLTTCFCREFGSGPCDGQGADLLLTDCGESYFVEAYSEQGKEILEQYGAFFSSAGLTEALAAKEALAERLAGLFRRRADVSGVKEVLDRHFELPLWEELARKCIGCGICTYVCPTCHCFDIIDHGRTVDRGGRYRCWDSCMFPDFTRMAGGHNPRPGRKERLRNRFMHKLKYHLDRYGLAGCVGCGRCIEKCPVNIDITDIIERIKGGEGR